MYVVEGTFTLGAHKPAADTFQKVPTIYQVPGQDLLSHLLSYLYVGDTKLDFGLGEGIQGRLGH